MGLQLLGETNSTLITPYLVQMELLLKALGNPELEIQMQNGKKIQTQTLG